MKYVYLILLILLVFTGNAILALEPDKIVTIDMPLVVSLHPKMALFDFNRFGFYKVEFGLSDEEFAKRVSELKSTAPKCEEEIARLNAELEKLRKEMGEFQLKYANTKGALNKYIEGVNTFIATEKALLERKKTLEWQRENNDLTSLNETIELFKNIKEDIYFALNNLVKEHNYALVINSSLKFPYEFSEKYIHPIEGHGNPGINFSLFYAFRLKSKITKMKKEDFESVSELNWYELTQEAKNLNSFPMIYYPTVLSGGKNINLEIIKQLYEKYKIKPEIYKAVASVLAKVDKPRHGKQIERSEIR